MKIDPRLRLRHLNCFLEIAQAGSLVAAADRLAITQPAASKTLRELEDILGKQLFDRSGRRLRLNAAGQMFQRIAGSAMADLLRAQNAVRGIRLDTIRLTIGVLPTAATDLMPRAALAFRARHPNCVLRLSTGPNWLLMSQLLEGSLDLVVGLMPEPGRMKGVAFTQLYPERIIAVVRSGHPLDRPIRPEDLGAFDLIIPPSGAVIGTAVRAFLVSLGAGSIAPAFETVSLAAGRALVEGSDAIWFISRGVVARDMADGRLRSLPMDHPLQAGPVGVSRREADAVSPVLDDLVETIKLAAQEVDGPAG